MREIVLFLRFLIIPLIYVDRYAIIFAIFYDGEGGVDNEGGFV